MSVLAYSELLKRITGIQERDLELPFKILNKNNTTSTRLLVIRELAKQDISSIGHLLQSVKLPKGGGSYLTIRKYFDALEKDGLLVRVVRGKKTLWRFSDKGEYLRRYIAS